MSKQQTQQAQAGNQQYTNPRLEAIDARLDRIALFMEEQQRKDLQYKQEEAVRMKEENKRRKEENKRRKEEDKLRQEEAEFRKQLELQDQQRRANMEAYFQKMEEDREKREKAWNEKFGGFINNDGDIYEEYFAKAIEASGLLVHNLQFNEMYRNQMYLKQEVDVLLTNGESIMIVEVKKKAHLNDLAKLKEKVIPTVYEWVLGQPRFKNFKLYVCLASFVIPDDVADQAKQDGILLLSRNAKTEDLLDLTDWELKNF